VVGILSVLVPEESEEPVWLVGELVAVTVVPVVPLVPDVDDVDEAVISNWPDRAKIVLACAVLMKLRR